MANTVFRKQISIFVALDDWKAIRREAARQRIPMTELCRRWMHPSLHRLLTEIANDNAPERDVASESDAE